MNWKLKCSILCGCLLGLFIAGLSSAATVPYMAPKHVFSIDDVLGTWTGTTYAQDSSIICTDATCPGEQPKIDVFSGEMLYPIDSDFCFDTTDFVGAVRRNKDGLYQEGWIGNLTDDLGNPAGVVVSSPETPYFKTGSQMGSWCLGMSDQRVKCSAEKYTVMEHVLTCTEKVPYFYTDPFWATVCEPLEDVLYRPADPINPVNPFHLYPNSNNLDEIAVGDDYSMTMKDDGKFLHRWGSIHKRPTDVRMYAKIAVPQTWKDNPGTNYTVTRAELIVNHKITNSPNDQIRPEDFENEGAKGRKPGFIDTGGVWTSDRDCFEGDGHFIPAGTLFKDPAYAEGEPYDSDGDGLLDSGGFSVDMQYGFTNAYFTTLDRDPFEPDEFGRWGPRYRLKSTKFGQDIPAIEVPVVDCTEPPMQKEEIKYQVGTDTTTVINLLDWEDGPSPLSTSDGWKAYNDLDPEDPTDVPDGLSHVEGLPLTDDFDLAIYVKGDYKPTAVYNTILLIEYEDPAVSVQVELCSDGVDNDGDGLVDCEDTADCGGFWCPETACNDLVDNDGDGYVDCRDPDCLSDPWCYIPDDGEICNDGLDNDLDGLVDCDDPGCADHPACTHVEICNDGLDNDGNGLIDCLDPKCDGTIYCTVEEICNDHIDNNDDGLTDCADPECFGTPACVATEWPHCDDGGDNDGDGFIDCDDPDCAKYRACR